MYILEYLYSNRNNDKQEEMLKTKTLKYRYYNRLIHKNKNKQVVYKMKKRDLLWLEA